MKEIGLVDGDIVHLVEDKTSLSNMGISIAQFSMGSRRQYIC
jgi:hypothetical protein